MNNRRFMVERKTGGQFGIEWTKLWMQTNMWVSLSVHVGEMDKSREQPSDTALIYFTDWTSCRFATVRQRPIMHLLRSIYTEMGNCVAAVFITLSIKLLSLSLLQRMNRSLLSMRTLGRAFRELEYKNLWTTVKDRRKHEWESRTSLLEIDVRCLTYGLTHPQLYGKARRLRHTHVQPHTHAHMTVKIRLSSYSSQKMCCALSFLSLETEKWTKCDHMYGQHVTLKWLHEKRVIIGWTRKCFDS